MLLFLEICISLCKSKFPSDVIFFPPSGLQYFSYLQGVHGEFSRGLLWIYLPKSLSFTLICESHLNWIELWVKGFKDATQLSSSSVVSGKNAALADFFSVALWSESFSSCCFQDFPFVFLWFSVVAQLSILTWVFECPGSLVWCSSLCIFFLNLDHSLFKYFLCPILSYLFSVHLILALTYIITENLYLWSGHLSISPTNNPKQLPFCCLEKCNLKSQCGITTCLEEWLKLRKPENTKCWPRCSYWNSHTVLLPMQNGRNTVVSFL